MRFKISLVVLALGALPLSAAAQQPASALNQVVDRIVTQEQAEMQSIRAYTPLVETYIQDMRADPVLGSVPDGDKYFLGKAELAKGVDMEPLTGEDTGARHRLLAGLGSAFTLQVQFLPRGFLQMIYLDTNGFDRQHYNFDFVRREFLGEVRCLVFDVTPLPKSGRGRFLGRIWVEDQGYHIVRFNGAYTGSTKTSYYFHFDSWRVNAQPDKWLPAFIYSEEGDIHYALGKRLMFKAQTRLWGYNLGQNREEEELGKILIESSAPINDETQTAKDISPIQAQRDWDRQAEDNVVDRMERMGLMAPPGEVDKVLATVVNNLEVTNNLNIDPEIRCRVLTTSTFEAFTIGHTIVLSRGLVDVLPDEASLAAILSQQMGHVVLDHRIDTQFAFFDRLLFDDKDTFKHFGFARTPEEDAAADAEGLKLLKNSPYKDQLTTAQLFLQALADRSKDIPNLISPHLGDRVPNPTALNISSVAVTPPTSATAPGSASSTASASNIVVALPLGGRIKMNPYTDELQMLKSKPVGTVAEREKMPFEVTPFILYLTRYEADDAQSPTPGAVSADSKPSDASGPDDPAK